MLNVFFSFVFSQQISVYVYSIKLTVIALYNFVQVF